MDQSHSGNTQIRLDPGEFHQSSGSIMTHRSSNRSGDRYINVDLPNLRKSVPPPRGTLNRERNHNRQPLKGRTCCASTPCLQSGHSGFSRIQSPMQVQQNACPHVVTLGSFISSKHSVHFRCWRPSIHPIMVLSWRS